MSLGYRACKWWQKCDYDEFKKAGRIISKAMECGGSEVWLTSSNAWGDRTARGVGGEGVGVKAATTTTTPLSKRTIESDAYTRALAIYVCKDMVFSVFRQLRLRRRKYFNVSHQKQACCCCCCRRRHMWI